MLLVEVSMRQKVMHACVEDPVVKTTSKKFTTQLISSTKTRVHNIIISMYFW